MDIRRALQDPRTFHAQIDKLHAKYAHTADIYEIRQKGVPLSTICLDRDKVARILARTVSSGKYEFLPARVYRAAVKDKERVLYEFCLTDRIVQGVFASVIDEAVCEHLSPHVYSYIPGRNWWLAVSRFAAFLREHRRQRPDPRSRGLYVLRRDVHKYADNIPLGPESELWPIFREHLFPSTSGPFPADLWSMIERMARPEAYFDDGSPVSRIVGVATGSAIATPIFNLYLTRVDQQLAVPGSFYARYCDDILFAHPDPEVARWASETLERMLASLQLRTNHDKDRDLYLNGAGRPSPAWPDADGASALSFLGARVNFDGTVALSKKKLRHLLRDLTERARQAFDVLGRIDVQTAGRTICAVINAALDPNAAFPHKTALLLRTAITDRGQLKHLDYQIALIVLRLLTGESGAVAFRRISYRTLRRDWGLVSLYHVRNLRGRR